ncbi:unnamed protein product [Paramecium primaurelia]|uniref:Uncharacterized protein n=1 Tax=Paramecium primaurelia TaxID=5886 RepID=A0A8S1Q2D4_PARPR|nr:unnamed protein product [Paramecium primaurelia]
MIILRINEFRMEWQLIKIIKKIIQPFQQMNILKEYSETQRSYLLVGFLQQKIQFCVKYNSLLLWKSDEFAFILNFKSYSFYAGFQIIYAIDTRRLNKYFSRRINKISHLIIY